MKAFWEQAETETRIAAAQPDKAPKAKLVVTKKAVRKLPCWGGSGAAGEAEDVSSSSVSPALDRIKATSGAVVLDSHQSQQEGSPKGVATRWVNMMKDTSTTNTATQRSPVTSETMAPKPASPAWVPSIFAKNKAAPTSTVQQQPAAVTGTSTYFSSRPILGGAAPAAGAQRDVTVEEHITKFAGRMGNIVASSMAGGFGATLGSRAAHSVWTGMSGSR
ncbi:hypothetical protein WJX77_006781 [Trebouxia sp. C0004]